MEKKQTAVQWLYDRLKLSLPEEMKVLRGLAIVALEMEKEQMIDAYNAGLEDVIPYNYFDNTYKSKENEK